MMDMQTRTARTNTAQTNTTQTNTAQALVNLDAWLETMRQPGGYGGPVAHWWQNRYGYTGPGLDWRYEGLLDGYANLQAKRPEGRWLSRLHCAAADLITGQRNDGSYPASRFEINPGTLGTPHEAAASLGLLHALPHYEDEVKAAVLQVSRRNLENLIAKLWDGRGFNDRPGVRGRVPNKLATLAQVLLTYTEATGDRRYVPYARAALEDVLRFQIQGGRRAGAVHQYAPDAAHGDGRFFPFYAARCVPPLVFAATFFAEPRYQDAAERIVAFIDRTMNPGGSWPQIVYLGGHWAGERRAEWPRWVAGTADLLLAYVALGRPVPERALERLLHSQLVSGGFPTAEGFAGQVSQRPVAGPPDFRDVTPVVGWNDKVFKLLALLLDAHTPLPAASVAELELPVTVEGVSASFYEGPHAMQIRGPQDVFYSWSKDRPWAHTFTRGVELK